MIWWPAKDGDLDALSLYTRHYSFRRYKDGRKRKLFVGPGEKMVLVTAKTDALFIWRKFRSMDNQPGINCAVFRNESSVKSSLLIQEAMELAWRRWPGERLYTYINPHKIKSSNPGYCFKCAGWRKSGISKGGLIILDIEPLARGASI